MRTVAAGVLLLALLAGTRAQEGQGGEQESFTGEDGNAGNDDMMGNEDSADKGPDAEGGMAKKSSKTDNGIPDFSGEPQWERNDYDQAQRLCIFDFDETLKGAKYNGFNGVVADKRCEGRNGCWMKNDLLAHEGLDTVQKCLDQGYEIGLATASCDDEFFYEFLMKEMNQFPLNDPNWYGSGKVQSCQGYKTQAIDSIIDATGVPPECVVMFDNREGNRQFAEEAAGGQGIAFIDVNDNYGVTVNDFNKGMFELDATCGFGGGDDKKGAADSVIDSASTDADRGPDSEGMDAMGDAKDMKDEMSSMGNDSINSLEDMEKRFDDNSSNDDSSNGDNSNGDDSSNGDSSNGDSSNGDSSNGGDSGGDDSGNGGNGGGFDGGNPGT